MEQSKTLTDLIEERCFENPDVLSVLGDFFKSHISTISLTERLVYLRGQIRAQCLEDLERDYSEEQHGEDVRDMAQDERDPHETHVGAA